ncbi:MAG: KOW domain-containing RNA-binding protein [Oscillospiraceae bacterium]|jgi:ribosomal protein L14E/L6E/L27E|nr:KOW domain-containing RNA-binding protein [Oscillospiraceae bacterium]
MLLEGQVVRSVAGHDSDRFYMVVKLDKNSAWIADGARRKLLAPKRKNLLHLTKTTAVLDARAISNDKQLRLALKEYNIPNGGGAQVEREGGVRLV